MPTVPWIRLYQNWPRHRKTMALRNALGTAEPILCLWLWAAENAPDGDLGGMSDQDIEKASSWDGKRGKAVSAMVEAGFIDIDEHGSMRLHNWEKRAGAGVSNLERRRERERERMRRVRANKAPTGCEHVSEHGANAVSANTAPTLSLSPDLGLSGSSLSVADPDPDARTREDRVSCPTADRWLSYFSARYFEVKGRQYGRGEADAKATARLGEWLGTVQAERRQSDWAARERMVGEFLASAEPRTVASGWSFAFFVSAFRGLAIPPEQRPNPTINGKPAPMQARY